MTQTRYLKTLNDALSIATTLTKSWFRGHSRAVGQLVPRIFRPEYRDPGFLLFRPEFELWTIENFKRHAPAVSERVPDDSDRWAWLCLMQHHRMPTRLLDWTENALVALYFAVSDDGEADGELWALLPWVLNAKAGAGYGIPILSDSPHLKFLLREPYWSGSPHALCQEVGLIKAVGCPVAIEPRWVFPRMAVQASTFTMHPIPQEGKAITEVLTDPRHLVRYVIPSSSKPTLVQQLRSLCISERHLFPDLEGLSRMIVTDGHIVGYGPPQPPLCSGEYED